MQPNWRMLKELHTQIQPVMEQRDHGFRWRGKEISRIEGLSDAVFAFCITLLVVSLEAPKTFEELERMMHGFISFGLCFVLLLLIWHTQYIYFRRYALDDRMSFLLNAALLFVVALYVYPLKFLMNLLVNMLTRFQEVDKEGHVITAMTWRDWRPLMMIYSLGFIVLYVIFALMYWHAYRRRDELELSPMERYETKGVVTENILMVVIGAVAFALALIGIPQFSGLMFAVIAPAQTILGARHGRRRKELLSAEAT